VHFLEEASGNGVAALVYIRWLRVLKLSGSSGGGRRNRRPSRWDLNENTIVRSSFLLPRRPCRERPHLLQTISAELSWRRLGVLRSLCTRHAVFRSGCRLQVLVPNPGMLCPRPTDSNSCAKLARNCAGVLQPARNEKGVRNGPLRPDLRGRRRIVVGFKSETPGYLTMMAGLEGESRDATASAHA